MHQVFLSLSLSLFKNVQIFAKIIQVIQICQILKNKIKIQEFGRCLW